jgi:hypothetical protein
MLDCAVRRPNGGHGLNAINIGADFQVDRCQQATWNVNPHITATVYAHALAGSDDLAATAWEKLQKDAGGEKSPAVEPSH